MLVLSRKCEEAIEIQVDGYDDPIKITVVRICKNKVKLGVEADSKILVLRTELKNATPQKLPYRGPEKDRLLNR